MELLQSRAIKSAAGLFADLKLNENMKSQKLTLRWAGRRTNQSRAMKWQSAADEGHCLIADEQLEAIEERIAKLKSI